KRPARLPHPSSSDKKTARLTHWRFFSLTRARGRRITAPLRPRLSALQCDTWLLAGDDVDRCDNHNAFVHDIDPSASSSKRHLLAYQSKSLVVTEALNKLQA